MLFVSQNFAPNNFEEVLFARKLTTIEIDFVVFDEIELKQLRGFW
jgi:hypothetical protein